MVEVSASTNPLAVNLTVSYISGDSITHAYPYTHINRMSPCMQGKVGWKAVQVLVTFIQEVLFCNNLVLHTELQCIWLLHTLAVVHVIEVCILAIELWGKCLWWMGGLCWECHIWMQGSKLLFSFSSSVSIYRLAILHIIRMLDLISTCFLKTCTRVHIDVGLMARYGCVQQYFLSQSNRPSIFTSHNSGGQFLWFFQY